MTMAFDATNPPADPSAFESVPTTIIPSPSSPKWLSAPPPSAPEHAGGVRLVDDEDRIVASGAGDEARQGREIAVHAEDGLAHDQPAAAGGGRQELVEMVEVEMAVDLGGRTRKPAAIDDRRVVEGITEDEILGPGEGGEDTEVGEIAGTVEERALLALERGRGAPPAPRGGASSRRAGARRSRSRRRCGRPRPRPRSRAES